MKVEVELISEEIIKPSSSTPDDLRHYQLSLLDQLSPPVYNPLILFYEFNDEAMPSITEISNHLKRSLAEVLTLFYPLAGRIVDNKYVNCNDEGIPYVEARVKCELSEVLNNPAPGEFSKFMPFEIDKIDNKCPLGVQLNIFECGGFAIGHCISHKLADGLSHFMFSKTWATTALGDKTKIEHPEFISAELFPPRDFTPYDAGLGVTKYKVVKRFVFSASLIESLRARYSDSLGLESQKPISRVDALSAFIWSRYVANTKDIGPAEKLYMVLHSVNLRPRFDPPLPQHSFGNFYRAAMTAPFVSRGNDCYGLVMKQVREEIEKIDDHYMRSLQQGVGHLSELNESVDSVISGELITFSFSSFCRFPLYDNDFGWGKPIWVSSPPLTFKNLVVFMDTKEADGIEAYISLEEEVMAKFETDIEFLAYVSLSGC
ncbi:stemmadenine O-acetyltransferase-like isoform X1 [Argentina anserina]|uniref:stemmadenine O-acetyltransferase-like isoform X1 n=1 Tax=Argentina anserina TaxID=57926 RepID=UPI00217657DB|nr:stemmadenine O-acetyltransferase-like isoform X1 [Potentilla anserina]